MRREEFMTDTPLADPKTVFLIIIVICIFVTIASFMTLLYMDSLKNAQLYAHASGRLNTESMIVEQTGNPVFIPGVVPTAESLTGAAPMTLPQMTFVVTGIEKKDGVTYATFRNTADNSIITARCRNPRRDIPFPGMLYTVNENGVLLPLDDAAGQYQRFIPLSDQ